MCFHSQTNLLVTFNVNLQYMYIVEFSILLDQDFAYFWFGIYGDNKLRWARCGNSICFFFRSFSLQNCRRLYKDLQN